MRFVLRQGDARDADLLEAELLAPALDEPGEHRGIDRSRLRRHRALSIIAAVASLPTALYTAAQVRAFDRYAIDTLGIPGYTLMTRAGEAALRSPAHALAAGAAHPGALRRR